MREMYPGLYPSQLTDNITQSHGEQGVAGFLARSSGEPITKEMYPNVPKTAKNVPSPVLTEYRIEAISFGAYYCAAYRRDGHPDILLDDACGKPERFPSATAAVTAAKLALRFKPTAPVDEDLLGARRFHEVRAAADAALQLETLGGVIVDGRVIPVEVRRR